MLFFIAGFIFKGKKKQTITCDSDFPYEERGIAKVYLLLFTFIYCLITRVVNLDYGPAMGIYLIGLGVAKGFLSEEIKDVFNFNKSKYLYEKIRFKDSLMELLSLLLIFINSYLIDYEPFSLFEFAFLFSIFALVYRYVFWGITRIIRERVQP